MRGYAGDDAATAAAIDPDGWLHTGDLARFDAMENLYLVDRVKDLITHGGHHVTPVELEAELQALPAVADAAVVGRPHPEVGEVPVAYVVLHHPVQPSDLIEHLAGRLAPWKRLWDVVVVDELPRSPAGKLLRRLILERDRERANSHAGEGAAEPARQAGADGLRAQEKGSAR